MWCVENIELVSVELDLSTSGQGRQTATAVMCGGVRLFNAIQFVDVEPLATQVEVCECCGIAHCSHGNWVTFRRIGPSVVWLPAWEVMERGAWEESEYRPPSYFATKGAPIFGRSIWDQLRKLHEGLPACDTLPCINSREVARLSQWSAPNRVLGEFPSEPHLCRDLIIAVTEGDISTELSAVNHSLQNHFRNLDPMKLTSLSATFRPVEFWLDLPGTPAWKIFANVESQMCFLLNETMAIIRG